MALYEERGEQTPRTWLSRFARERMNLSASVEATLAEGVAPDDPGLDELREAVDQKDPGQGYKPRKVALIPPRLSLQSRVIPAVRSDDWEETASKSHTMMPVMQPGDWGDAALKPHSAQDKRQTVVPATYPNGWTEGREPVTKAPSVADTGMETTAKAQAVRPSETDSEQRSQMQQSGKGLARLAQRVAAALGLTGASERIVLVSQPAQAQETRIDMLDTDTDKQEVPFLDRKGDTAYSKVFTNVVGSLPLDPKRYHLSMHPLPTHWESPIVPPAGQRVKNPFEEKKDENGVERAKDPLQGILPVDAGKREGETSAHIPAHILAIGALREPLVGETSAHLPKVGPIREKVEEEDTTKLRIATPPKGALKGGTASAARGALSGAGVFEAGQCDLAVMNKHVTAASVVLVTLTRNPGPVVVQYISLQPQVGFTIHLTAPASARTPFNYIVLLGELF